MLRCSTADTSQDAEFHAQRASIGEAVSARGLSLGHGDVLEEVGVSGSAARRPQLEKVLELAYAGEVSHLFVADLDRLGRAGEETLWNVRQLVDDCDVEVIIARQPIDLRTLPGRLYLFAAAMAGLCKLDTVSKSTAAAYTSNPADVPAPVRVHPEGVTVARKSGKRVGQPPLLWTETDDARLLGAFKAGLGAVTIAESEQFYVGRMRQVDHMGRRVGDVPKGEKFVFSAWREFMQRPSAQAIRDRLAILLEREAKS